MGRRVILFGVVICEIIRAFSPVDEEVTLAHAVSYPIKTHVHGFGAALLHGVVGDASGACVVGLDGCCCLRVAHVAECGAEHRGLFSVEEVLGCDFGFCGGGEDVGDDGGVDVDGAIEGWLWVSWTRGNVGRMIEFGAEEEEAAGSRTGFLFAEV